MKITFLGAAGCVTGSCYLVETDTTRFLVDCGMFQGPRIERDLNYATFQFRPAQIDFVLLTHAHIDHSGLLPKLLRQGFRGRILTTAATRDLLEWMLPDACGIQEIERERRNHHRRLRGAPLYDPLYDEKDVLRTLRAIRTVTYDRPFEPVRGLEVSWHDAGHILGSASIRIAVGSGKDQLTVLFSGDVGSEDDPLQAPPSPPSGVDYLVLESTYGGRKRLVLDDEERLAQLERIVRESLARGGNLVIPSFAVERTQTLLYDLQTLFADGRLDPVDVYIDSPLAIHITESFRPHLAHLQPGNSNAKGNGDHELFRDPNFHYTRTVPESVAINGVRGAIILSASGMCDAGRIQHHLRSNLPDPAATILFVGYQAEGTLGRFLLEGKDTLRIHGKRVQVRARIVEIDTYSGHADHEGLLAYARAVDVRRRCLLTHGQEPSRQALSQALQSQLEVKTWLPSFGERYDLALDLSESQPRTHLGEFLETGDREDADASYHALLIELARYMESDTPERERRSTVDELRKHLARHRS